MIAPHNHLLLSVKQLEVIVQLGEEDPDVDYEELMEIVKLARKELRKTTKAQRGGGGKMMTAAPLFNSMIENMSRQVSIPHRLSLHGKHAKKGKEAADSLAITRRDERTRIARKTGRHE